MQNRSAPKADAEFQHGAIGLFDQINEIGQMACLLGVNFHSSCDTIEKWKKSVSLKLDGGRIRGFVLSFVDMEFLGHGKPMVCCLPFIYSRFPMKYSRKSWKTLDPKSVRAATGAALIR